MAGQKTTHNLDLSQKFFLKIVLKMWSEHSELLAQITAILDTFSFCLPNTCKSSNNDNSSSD